MSYQQVNQLKLFETNVRWMCAVEAHVKNYFRSSINFLSQISMSNKAQSTNLKVYSEYFI